jgi:rhodanese-related sulfurtransferase
MYHLYKTVLVAFFIVTTVRCSTAQDQSEVVVIDAKQLIELQSKGVTVIDVRTPEEVSQGKIPGARHIQLADDMASKMTDIDKNQPVIVYCRSGARSTNASLILRKEGYITIYNYVGSMNDWVANGNPVER